MQIRSKREIFLIIVCVIFVVGSIVYVMMPPSSASKRGQLSKNDALAKLAAMKSTEKQMTNDHQKMVPRIKQMSYTQPAEELIPRVIRDLQASADRAGIHLREVKPLRPRLIAGGAGTRVPLEVRFRASFQPNVVKFLYFVEDPASRMVVDKINISSTDAKFKMVDVSAQITVYTRSSVGVSGTEGGETSNGKVNKS
jgi:hypothetical protein